MKLKCPLLIISILLESFSVFSQNIEITNETTFHRAVWGTYGTLESTAADNGGILYVFVKNNDAQPDSIIDFEITQNGIPATLEGWRAWPYIMQATGNGNNVSTITAKGVAMPLRENDTLTIRVTTQNGATAYQTYTCRTPEIRLANVIPSQDMQTLYIYLRSDAPANFYDFAQLIINEQVFTVGNELSIVGGNTRINPNELMILKLTQNNAFKKLYPFAIRLATVRLAGGDTVWTGAGIRVVPSEFFIGTWHSSGLNQGNEDVRIRNRRLRYNNIHGVNNHNLMSSEYQKYFIKNIRQPNFGNPFNATNGAVEVIANSGQPYLRYWSLDDEPDLSNKPMFEQMEKNRVYWENDSLTPSFVNLAVQKKYSHYGWLPDVVSMDHYAAPDAPNIIPNTWIPVIGRKGEMREALEYSEYLKFNTEPRRMTSWCQFEANTWGSDPREQPRDYAINYQFWAHIAGGAKSIEFFVLQGKTEFDIPEQYLEGIKLTRQSSAIRGQIMYNEYSKKVTTTAPFGSYVSARALIGEDAMVLMALNDNFTFTAAGLYWETDIDSTTYILDFELPQWISNEEVYQLLPDGSMGYDFNIQNLGNNNFRIVTNSELYKESHVFVIGRKDIIAPNAPMGLNIPQHTDDFNYVLSWDEPFDNFGSLGYILKFNGATVDTVYSPIYVIENDSSFNCNSTWEVYAFDNSWNISAPAAISIAPLNPDETGSVATIITQPQSIVGYCANFLCTLDMVAENAADYEWQFKLDDNMGWQTVNDGITFSNSNTASLTIDQNSWEFNQFNIHYPMELRAIAKGFCLPHDTSEMAIVWINPENVYEKRHSLNAKIHPNPNNGVFYLQISNNVNTAEIFIIDVLGKVVQQHSLSNVSGTISHVLNIEEQTSGIYLVHISSGNQKQTLRVVRY